jgi:hypothetical protein
MAVVHGYVTLVADSDTANAASIGTISLQALAEQDLADMLRAADYDGFISGLSQLFSENGEPELQVVRLNLPDSSLLTSAEFPHRVGAVLDTDQLEEAVAAWYNPQAHGDTLTDFAVSLLESTVLAEYSDAAAMAAAGAVGAASMGGSATVVAALVSAGSVGGVAILIAGPVGVVVLGVAATVITFRLLTRKRRQQAF